MDYDSLVTVFGNLNNTLANEKEQGFMLLTTHCMGWLSLETQRSTSSGDQKRETK